MSTAPIIVLGKKPNIATIVRDGLKPEYDGNFKQKFPPFTSPLLTKMLESYTRNSHTPASAYRTPFATVEPAEATER